MSSSSRPDGLSLTSLLRDKGRPLLAPSLLAADFGAVAEEVARAEGAGADLLHLDVMDGHFVPNLTFGPVIVKAVRRRTSLALDVHLMIENPAALVPAFHEAGADSLTFHIEAVAEAPDVERTIAMIRDRSMRAGISLRPGTPVERVLPFLGEVDIVLVMSVDPGFGGQPFIPESLPRISTFAARRAAEGTTFVISVDGGITNETAREVTAAGADILVAGTALYGPGDMAAKIAAMRAAGRSAVMVRAGAPEPAPTGPGARRKSA